MIQQEADAGLPALVEFRSVDCRFGETFAVRDCNLKIRRGEIFAILGPSGCGKSTLLRLLAGLETPSSGDIALEGQSLHGLAPWERPVNMMFQSYALFPHMTVEQNIAFGLRQERLDSGTIAARVDEVLGLVKMEAYRGRRPAQLSGGQQQRIALARSLAKQPKLLLLDEPMAALDRKLRAEMQFELGEIIRRVRVTCLMVTHDQEEAMVMADRMALMNEGRVVQIGTPAEIYEIPNSRFSAEFLGGVNLFEGTVIQASDGLLVAECADLAASLKVFSPEDVEPGQRVTVAVRPEKLLIRETAADEHHNGMPVVIEDVAYMGAQTAYHVRTQNNGRLLYVVEATQQRAAPYAHGVEAHLSWDIRDGVLLRS